MQSQAALHTTGFVFSAFSRFDNVKGMWVFRDIHPTYDTALDTPGPGWSTRGQDRQHQQHEKESKLSLFHKNLLSKINDPH
jgi:hypothetical protein